MARDRSSSTAPTWFEGLCRARRPRPSTTSTSWPDSLAKTTSVRPSPSGMMSRIVGNPNTSSSPERSTSRQRATTPLECQGPSLWGTLGQSDRWVESWSRRHSKGTERAHRSRLHGRPLRVVRRKRVRCGDPSLAGTTTYIGAAALPHEPPVSQGTDGLGASAKPNSSSAVITPLIQALSRHPS